MASRSASISSLRKEVDGLRKRLGEAEQTLRAIRAGDVDALVVDGAAGPQIYALQGLDAEANRFRGEILAQISDSVIASDSEERIVYLNSAAEELYGVAASEALGRELSDVYVRRWSDPDDGVAATRALRECGEWRGETVHVTRDGHDLQVESRLTRMKGIDGRPTVTLAVVRDVTERNRREERVHISEIRYRRLFEAAHDGVLILDSGTGKIIEANPFMTRMLGYPHDYLIGKELFEIGLLKDGAASREMFQKLKRTNEVRYENLPLEGHTGKHQEVEVVANLYDENGRSVIQCNIRDITERKRSEEHVKLLMAEVNHRAKNLLAVVQAVAQQTAKYCDPATFATRLSERIAGLAAGQDLLVRTEWQGIAVSDLVAAQLAHFGDLMGKRVLLDGPVVWLTAPAAQGIGMALHELATNAAKYGALSNREGKVRINWGVTAHADSTFSMSWTENGGPKVEAPNHRGFGQIVIGRMAEAAVSGVAEIEFRESGFLWTLTAPAKYTLAASRTEAK